MRVLYLNHTDLATQEDKRYGLDYWAEAFRARTWEELKKLAEKGEVFREMAEAVYTVNADVSQRSIAEAHRKYVETYTTLKNGLARAEKKLADAEQRADDEKQRADASESHAAEAEKRIRELEALLAERKA